MPVNKNRESELRAFDIDATKVRHSIKLLGAEAKGLLQFKRAVLDVVPVNPNKWIRVRTDGKTTTLAIKERIARTVDGTGEVEVEVYNGRPKLHNPIRPLLPV